MFYIHDFYMFHINLHPFYMFLHIFYKTLQVNQIILVCVVMVQVSYIPRCRVMLDLPNLGAFGPQLCKSRITHHLGIYVTYTYQPPYHISMQVVIVW